MLEVLLTTWQPHRHYTLDIECKGVLSTGAHRLLIGNRGDVGPTRHSTRMFATVSIPSWRRKPVRSHASGLRILSTPSTARKTGPKLTYFRTCCLSTYNNGTIGREKNQLDLLRIYCRHFIGRAKIPIHDYIFLRFFMAQPCVHSHTNEMRARLPNGYLQLKISIGEPCMVVVCKGTRIARL